MWLWLETTIGIYHDMNVCTTGWSKLNQTKHINDHLYTFQHIQTGDKYLCPWFSKVIREKYVGFNEEQWMFDRDA